MAHLRRVLQGSKYDINDQNSLSKLFLSNAHTTEGVAGRPGHTRGYSLPQSAYEQNYNQISQDEVCEETERSTVEHQALINSAVHPNSVFDLPSALQEV